MKGEAWTGIRFGEPAERLTRAYFDPEHLFRGRCMYCKDDFDEPGPVFIWRDQATLQLKPDHCNCVLCGQRYFVEYEDLEVFCGYPPSMERIYDWQKHFDRYQARYRSIDADWNPGS